jgi:hypothetical protein
MPGQSRGYVLTASQQEALGAVLSAQDEEAHFEEEAKKAKTRKNAAVGRALRRGVPAPVLAHHLGVSDKRVYQMRDNTR